MEGIRDEKKRWEGKEKRDEEGKRKGKTEDEL